MGSRRFLLADLSGEAAAVELERDVVADLDLGSVAEDGTRGVGGDGVTAFEDFQRAALFELQGEPGKALALGADAKIGGAPLEPQAKRSDLHPKIKRDDSQLREREAFTRLFEARAKA